ncbi:MAG: hypothetical protein JSV78_13190 [Phycisphaerales bacterium]|nr:MAG: hypothetical protein JSV78_13190 [Phycisphaerales bacterium]
MLSRSGRHEEHEHLHFLTISCFEHLRFFRHDSVKEVFIDGMRHTRDQLNIRWIGYVIMPEHVHLIVFTRRQDADDPIPISAVLQTLREHVAKHGKEALRTVWAHGNSLGTGPLDAWATGPALRPFWKNQAYDFNIACQDALFVKLDYMHKNPVRAGLVDRTQDWVWSSYRFYEFGDDSLIAMDWDGSWPIA